MLDTVKNCCTCGRFVSEEVYGWKDCCRCDDCSCSHWAEYHSSEAHTKNHTLESWDSGICGECNTKFYEDDPQ